MSRLTITILVFIFCLGVLATATGASVPSIISYQGRLTDLDNNPVEDNDYLIMFTIYGSPTGSDILWSSDYQTVSVTNGLFNYILGSNEPLPLDFFNDGSDRYLGIKVGVDPEISPRTRLASVAFAYHSSHSDEAEVAILSQDIVCTNCVSSSDIAPGAVLEANLGNDAVTTDKIADGSIQLSDLDQNGATANQIIKRNSSNTAWEVVDNEVGGHTGAIYRWNTFQTYHNNSGWMMSNNSLMFGGINPSSWSDGNYTADRMSPDMEVLRTLFTRKGYGGKNANVVSDVFFQYSSTNGKHTVVLFRIKNTTGSDIPWTVDFYYSAHSQWSERASVALNGTLIWVSTGISNPNSNTSEILTIPANSTSTVIFVSSGGNQLSITGNITVREHKLGFFNNTLELPAGLEYVDDLDVATALLE